MQVDNPPQQQQPHYDYGDANTIIDAAFDNEAN